MADDKAMERIAKLIDPLRVAPGSKVTLAKDFDPGYKAGFVKKKHSAELLQRGVELLTKYQARLAAQDTHGVLVVLQALDAAGKDGTIRHVMSGVNPHYPKVTAEALKALQEVKLELEAEAPKGAAADPFAAENGGANKQAVREVRDIGGLPPDDE